MNSARHARSPARRDGCAFLMLTCLFTCFFLVLNSALVSRFYPLLAEFGPELLRWPRVEQMMMFVGPVLLIFVEWWLVDFVVDLVSPLSQGRKTEPNSSSWKSNRS